MPSALTMQISRSLQYQAAGLQWYIHDKILRVYGEEHLQTQGHNGEAEQGTFGWPRDPAYTSIAAGLQVNEEPWNSPVRIAWTKEQAF